MAHHLEPDLEGTARTEIADHRRHLGVHHSRPSRARDTATTIGTVVHRRRNSMEGVTVRLRMRMGERALGGTVRRLDLGWAERQDQEQDQARDRGMAPADLADLPRGHRVDLEVLVVREDMAVVLQGMADRGAMATGMETATAVDNTEVEVEVVHIGKQSRRGRKKDHGASSSMIISTSRTKHQSVYSSNSCIHHIVQHGACTAGAGADADAGAREDHRPISCSARSCPSARSLR